MFREAWATPAARAYRKLSDNLKARVDEAVVEILQDPFGCPNCSPLAGQFKGKWRRRVGNLRLFYSVDTGQRVVNFLVLRDRKEAYR